MYNRTIFIVLAFCGLIIFASCGSKSNKRAVDAKDLEKVMQEEAANAPAKPARNILSANELMQLADCADAACVQLFMKDRSQDFFYPKKGEYTSQNRGMIVDSLGSGILAPFSTVYFASEPGATWRIAHTVHKKEFSDELLADFAKKGFVLADSSRYYATKAKAYRYTSPQYPGTVLYYSPTYTPWYAKGLYLGSTWACYVFEVHHE